MANLYNIQSIKLSGNVITGVRSEEIEENEQVWPSQEVVSMAAVKGLFNKLFQYAHVSLADMIQNGCYYFDGNKPLSTEELVNMGIKIPYSDANYYRDLFYGLVIHTFSSNSTFNLDDCDSETVPYTYLIPSYAIDISNYRRFTINDNVSSTIFNFKTNTNFDKLILSDALPITDIRLKKLAYVLDSPDKIYNYNENIVFSKDGVDLIASLPKEQIFLEPYVESHTTTEMTIESYRPNYIKSVNGTNTCVENTGSLIFTTSDHTELTFSSQTVLTGGNFGETLDFNNVLVKYQYGTSSKMTTTVTNFKIIVDNTITEQYITIAENTGIKNIIIDRSNFKSTGKGFKLFIDAKNELNITHDSSITVTSTSMSSTKQYVLEIN